MRSRAPHYFAIKFMRKRASQGALLDAPARPWRRLRTDLLAWCDDVGAELPEGIEKTWPKRGRLCHRQRVTLYTDASESGYGAIAFFDDGRIAVVAGRWGPELLGCHINILEAEALYISLTTIDWAGTTEIEVTSIGQTSCRVWRLLGPSLPGATTRSPRIA